MFSNLKKISGHIYSSFAAFYSNFNLFAVFNKESMLVTVVKQLELQLNPNPQVTASKEFAIVDILKTFKLVCKLVKNVLTSV